MNIDPHNSNHGPEGSAGGREPFVAPEGFFEQFADRLQKSMDAEELSSIAPILASLPRMEPFAAPDHFFEELPVRINTTIHTAPRGFSWKAVFRPQWALLAAGISVIALLLFTSPPTASVETPAEVSLADVAPSELDAYVENEIPLALDEDEIGELLALESSGLPSGVSEDALNEYIVDEIELEEIIEEF